jgi:hypothetical protein
MTKLLATSSVEANPRVTGEEARAAEADGF